MYLEDLLFLDSLGDFAEEGPPRACSACNHSEVSLFRCISYTLSHSTCASCSVKQHRCLLFHKIEVSSLYIVGSKKRTNARLSQKWNGLFFEQATLNELGMELHLGHWGEQCPNPSIWRKMIIGDINGFHTITVCYCNCSGVSKGNQLLQSRILPVSMTGPRSAFTFNAVEFHELTLQGKTTAYNFYRALERRTDNLSVVSSVCPY